MKKIYLTSLIFALNVIHVKAQIPQMLKDIYTRSENSNPSYMVDVNGTLFFFANTSAQINL